LHYGVKNENATYCLIFDSDIAGTVNYNDTVKNVTVAYPFSVLNTLNSSTEFGGNCWTIDPKTNVTNEKLTVKFFPNDIKPLATEALDRWSIDLVFGTFTDNDTTFKIIDYKLNVIFYPSLFNTSHGTNKVTYHPASGSDPEWHAKETNGFTCSSAVLKLTNESSLNFDHLKVVAFANLPTDQFPQSQLFEQCKADMRTSDLVPIIVGACLAGLVIIVLIAYLIGRARAKRQGYASV